MSMRIALVGNPNSGKTTLFNALTGANQFVGNWPGVTIEKKEGKYRKNTDVTIADLPGIYSLSPYTPEERIARNYLMEQRPDAILNIVDGSNLERNLYLTTQLLELGIPTVLAVNMMDVLEKRGDQLRIEELERSLGCRVLPISALKSRGINEAAEAAIEAAGDKTRNPMHTFSGTVEHAVAHIEEAVLHHLPEEQQRWYAVKIFERDHEAIAHLNIPEDRIQHVEQDIVRVEKEYDDDSESIITNERYVYIASLIDRCLKKQRVGVKTPSDRIDSIVTNRFLSLPIFAVIMFLVYYISVTTVGDLATNWANDGVFGDGWHLFGMGSAQYEEAAEEYRIPGALKEGFLEAVQEADAALPSQGEDEEIQPDPAKAKSIVAQVEIRDDEGELEETVSVNYEKYLEVAEIEEPDPANYGVWVPGIPVLAEQGLDAIGVDGWLKALILDGIIAGVGAVLGFVPQMLILFLFLAFLEACGYMARVAFIMDRIFRKFGLSGKSFIPMLISSGCGVPGIMASRTIESERDRRMTIMTTTFVPCGAKLPVIALIAGALFGRAGWVAASAYFLGVAAIIISGIILKKTVLFQGDPAPFVMELPAYHWPTIGNLLRSMWERGWSFIKKAGTIILLATIFVWFTSHYGFVDGSFGQVEESKSLLALVGNALAWIFIPLGWGNWQSTVASITGLIAKENVVGTIGVLFGGMDEVAENGWQVWANVREAFTPLAAYSFLAFNLLCAPCFAAIGAIRREMNSAKWTWFALLYQCGFAYAVALIIYQIGCAVTGDIHPVGLVAALVILVLGLFLLLRKDRSRLQIK